MLKKSVAGLLALVMAVTVVFSMLVTVAYATDLSSLDVEFLDADNKQIMAIGDNRTVKVDYKFTGKDGIVYLAVYKSDGSLKTIKGYSAGTEIKHDISAGTGYILVFAYDWGNGMLTNAVKLPAKGQVYAEEEPKADKEIISIATVRDNRDAIYTLTTDDGYSYTTAYFDKKFNELGLKGTMGLVPDWIGRKGFMTWEEAEKYINSKNSLWGVANHTKAHIQAGFGELSEEQLEVEIGNGKKILKEHFPNSKLLTMWTPGTICVDLTQTVTKRYHDVLRVGGVGQNRLPITRREMLGLGGYMFLSNTTADKMKELADNAVKYKSWLVEVWHGVGDVDGADWGGNVSESVATTHLVYMSKLNREGKIWVATMDEATAYAMERLEAKISVLSQTENEIKFTLTDNLDDKIYDEELTVNVKLPDGWNRVKVTQKNLTVSSSIKDGVVTFNVKPDSGEILIKKI